MLRFVVLLLLVLVLLWFLENAHARWRAWASRRTERPTGPPAAGAPADGRLIACHACGVHVLESRALWERTLESSPDPFCSEACRQRARAAS